MVDVGWVSCPSALHQGCCRSHQSSPWAADTSHDCHRPQQQSLLEVLGEASAQLVLFSFFFWTVIIWEMMISHHLGDLLLPFKIIL